MLHYLDLIIYLWLVPVTFLLFFALTQSISGFPLPLTRHVFFTGKTVDKEKRKYSRFSSCTDIYAEITVGDTICIALVSDISQIGISLKHLPDIFSYKINTLSVVIRQSGVDYNMLLKTKWVVRSESGKQIGAEIDMASPEWSQLLLQTENGNQLKQA